MRSPSLSHRVLLRLFYIEMIPVPHYYLKQHTYNILTWAKRALRRMMINGRCCQAELAPLLDHVLPQRVVFSNDPCVTPHKIPASGVNNPALFKKRVNESSLSPLLKRN